MNRRNNTQPEIYGIFGYPVEHSASPVMHNAAFKELNMNAEYRKFPVAPDELQDATGNIIPNGFLGINVTIPHKQTIIKYLDELSQSAKNMGAVNTIEIKHGKLIGHNTDGDGFKIALKSQADFELKDKIVFIAGAGGAGFAVATKCAEENVKRIGIMDIDAAKTTALTQHIVKILKNKATNNFIEVFSPYQTDKIESFLRNIDLAVNATPLGMKTTDPLPFPTDNLPQKTVIYDLVYNIPVTKLVDSARKRGLQAYTGLTMLLFQGVEAFKIWTGINPPVAVMKKALEDFVYGAKY